MSSIKGLYRQLAVRYQGTDNLDLVCDDIRTFDFARLPSPYLICANIPYYLTARLWRRLIELEVKPTRGALLLPGAVCQTLVTTSKRSRLATLTSFHYQLTLGRLVPAKYFSPPPRIDSPDFCAWIIGQFPV